MASVNDARSIPDNAADLQLIDHQPSYVQPVDLSTTDCDAADRHPADSQGAYGQSAESKRTHRASPKCA
jgi:hypothetical protein